MQSLFDLPPQTLAPPPHCHRRRHDGGVGAGKLLCPTPARRGPVESVYLGGGGYHCGVTLRRSPGLVAALCATAEAAAGRAAGTPCGVDSAF